jgi:hypothetical protein
MLQVTLEMRTKIRVGFHLECILVMFNFNQNRKVSAIANKTKQCKSTCK